ncbi:MAG: hypothetical protein JWP00_314 [Chloroflexi bacterium]|nr:hypothetical protein [Chloroflexota bacterium]
MTDINAQNLPPQVGLQLAAQEAARLGEALVLAVRQSNLGLVEQLVAPGSAAGWSVRLFGLGLLRLDLRLDDPREQGQLKPYDLQIEPGVALLELGVIQPLAVGEVTAQAERPHLTRLFGSSLVLCQVPDSEYGWLLEEVLPVNATGQLNPADATDAKIIEVHQGKLGLPLRLEKLSPVENIFLARMQSQAGRFNLEELYNAARLWQDFRERSAPDELEQVDSSPPAEWAAGVEYLITLFDYHQADMDEVSQLYAIKTESLADKARELAFTLRVTQFDDRYSIHPDPVGHYRALFGELGINPKRDEKLLEAQRKNIFDSIEVPPDDDTFFGPR